MVYDENNLFARILRDEVPCYKIYEDAYALAFQDINPQAPVHVLVIPKGQYTSMADFGENANAGEITGFYRAVSKVARELNLVEDGFRAIANIGDHGGQEVPHYHVHLIGGKKLGAMVSKAA